MRHAAWHFAINCTAFNYSAFNILLEPQVAALHQLLDLFLADPDLAVVHQADQRQVHLVVTQLRYYQVDLTLTLRLSTRLISVRSTW